MWDSGRDDDLLQNRIMVLKNKEPPPLISGGRDVEVTEGLMTSKGAQSVTRVAWRNKSSRGAVQHILFFSA